MQNTLACKFSSFNRNILLAAKKTKKTQFFCYFFLMIAVRSCFFLTNQQKAHSMWINSLAYQQACQQRGASVCFLSLKGMIWLLIIQHLTGLNVTTKKQKSYKCGCHLSIQPGMAQKKEVNCYGLANGEKNPVEILEALK